MNLLDMSKLVHTIQMASMLTRFQALVESFFFFQRSFIFFPKNKKDVHKILHSYSLLWNKF